MAVVIPAGVTDYLQRTASLLNPAASSTVMLWANFGVLPAPADYNLAYALLDDPAVYADFASIDTQSGTGILDISASVPIVTPALTLDTWYHFAWVQSGTTQLFYMNGVLIGSNVKNRAAFVVGFEMLGNDTFATGDLTAQYFRSWQAALSLAEINAELVSATVVRTSNLFMNTPLLTDGLDISGNGRNWTTVGSVTFGAGPNPDNSTPATATVIAAVPYATAQSLTPVFTAWYRYTAVSEDNVLGPWGFGDLSVYKPATWIYSGPDASTLTLFGSNNSLPNVPMQLPVTVGTTYWFKFIPNTGDPQPATLTFTLDRHTDVEVPAGSLAINYDSGDLPLALLDSTVDQTVLRFVQDIAAGSSGDILDDGTLLLEDATNGNLQLYDAEYAHLAQVASSAVRISCNRTDTFYVSTAGSGMTNAVATTVSNTGVLGGTSWTLNDVGVSGIAPSPDETILYYTSSVHSSVQRFDLVNNVALTDLTALPNRPTGDLICLSDGSVIVPIPNSDEIRNYSAAGALLHTYTATDLTVSDRLCRDLTDASFWWWHVGANSNATPVFKQILVSDGTVLTTLEKTYYEASIYGGTATATPTSRYGHSNSCPMWVTRVSVVPPPTPGVVTTEYLIRRERWFPVISSEQRRMFFKTLQLYFEAGTGIPSGQGSNPIVELDWSDDGGHTWSHLHLIETGRQGQYQRRAIQRMMGQSRERIYRVAVTDPVQWALIDAFLEAEQGTS